MKQKREENLKRVVRNFPPFLFVNFLLYSNECSHILVGFGKPVLYADELLLIT